MAYITRVRIQGFQSHLDSTFTLSPGLNVITGPSDAGKTAIIRALRWFAFNEPQGEAFIHAMRDNSGEIIQTADRATVAVEFDNGIEITKTRRKGKTVYTHSEYPDAWEKAELPLEIKEVLGLDKQRYGDNFDTCLNFAYQLDPPFLLSETGSVGAKVLGKLAGTEVVDKAIGVIVKRTHQTREIIRQADKAVGQYDTELLGYHCDSKGKHSPWRRIAVEEIATYQHEEAKDYNCFATVQRYVNASKVDGEAFLAPLYFDLDYDADPTVAQADAVKIVDFFLQELDLKETDIQIYFSGNKGFHILLDERALGIKPRADLNKVYKHIAGYLRYRLGETQQTEDDHGKPVEKVVPLPSLDMVVYTVKRMLRLPYSRHQTTGLYKIELSRKELGVLSLDEIRERAKTGSVSTDVYAPAEREKAVRKRPKAGAFYADKMKEYSDAAATAQQRYDKEEYIFIKDKPPVCVQDILKGGWKKDGDRNQATVQLACYFKTAGYKKEEASKTLEEWVVQHTSAEGNYMLYGVVRNT